MISKPTIAVDLQANVESMGSMGFSGGQAKLAPIGKMYVANQRFSTLSVVNDPNNLTYPDYQFATITLPGGTASRFGQPQTATGCPIPQIAPSNLTATAVGFNRIDLAWESPIDDSIDSLIGYRIDRSSNGTTWTTSVSNTGNTATSYQNIGLFPATWWLGSRRSR
jgi:hypothetical protein